MRAFSAAVLALFCLGTAYAQSVENSYHYPVQAELLSWVSARYLHPGSPVFVKVLREWSGLGCSLHEGQILEAKVMLASPLRKKVSDSQLALSFAQMPCAAEKRTIDLVIGAVAWDSGASRPSSPFSAGRGSIGATGGIQRSFNVDALQLMSLNSKSDQGKLKPGAVVGIKGVGLQLGKGPERSSLLTSSARDVYLEKDSVFILVPESIALARSTAEVTPTASTASLTAKSSDSVTNDPPADAALVTHALPPPPVEFQPCEPPLCSDDVLSGSITASETMKSIEIRPLGYAPRPQRELEDLDDDEALAWLGPRELLVAFNPHRLIERDGSQGAAALIRRIHAVVLDPVTQKVGSSADWELPDRGEYLWQLSGNRILVHAGSELRIYSSGLKVDARIPLEGPLAFVRTSPNGELIAVAELKERHLPEQHSRLRESLELEPEEDVEIRILNRDFETIAQASSSSEIMPLILLNEGQVQLLAQPKMKYRLALQPWAGDAVTVAHFASSCLPSVSSFAPNLLFVRSCAVDTGVHEYRVLRSSGGVVMRGKSDPQDLGQGVLGNEENFAVRVLHATRAIVRRSVFRGSELDFQELRIYRSGDGRRLASTRLELPPPTRNGFALLSDGSQLAVLSGSKIHLLAVPVK